MDSGKIKIDEKFIGKNNQATTKQIMTAVSTFKSAITRIRDILRGPGLSITGMDSMRHICLYLLSRYMTKEKVMSLGVPEEFAWENLLDTALTKNGGVQYALDRFYHAEEDCLVRHFDRLFGTEKFSFDIKNSQKHKEILEILNGVDMSDVDCQMDILGWVYEQHLKTGSSSAGRDLGQFFTDRFICEYMTELCAPGFKHPGVPESVCDPSMGTGGFLTSFIKYYKKHYPEMPIDWSVQEKEIHGNDTDPRVAGVARLNFFMETGGCRPTNLLTHDSLYGDLTQTVYDVILANMPFGLKGITHAECCERVKALKIRGTKSEPLFLQLMMVSLNRGGRCAVVVPDGMLVNHSSCHDGTRRYLLDHFELKRVIKMRGQFFMNTDIQPSILFFQNTGNPTTVVEFWDVVKGANGSIEETMVLSVPRERFDVSCSLDMRRYQEVKEVANSAGFQMVKLGDIAFNKKYPSHDTSVGKESGSSRFHTGGEYTRLYTDNPDIHDTIIIVNRTNGSGKSNIFIDSNCSVAKQTLVMSCDTITTTKYVFYWLSLNKHEIEKGYIGSNHKNLSNDFVKNMMIPLPPLPIQQEIVATLDRIYQPGTTELTDTLKMTDKAMDLVLIQPNGATLEPIVEAQRLIRKSAQMVADVKAQMVAIMKSVESRGFPVITLKEICEVHFGERITQKDDKGTRYPVYGSGSDTFKTDKYNRTGKTCKVGRFAISEPTMVMIVNDTYWLMDSGFTVTSKDETKIITEYLWYCLLADKPRLTTLSTGSCQKNIDMDSFYKVIYAIPPISFQRSLIARLDALQSQLYALESLQQQSEDNARFILESYLGSAKSAMNLESDEKQEALLSDSESDDEKQDTSSRVCAQASTSSSSSPAYSNMTREELKALCKEHKIKGFSTKKKNELVKMLEENDTQ